MSTTAETSPDSLTQIRPATVSDLESVFTLVEQLGIGERPNGDHILFVAESAGVVVGYALTTIARLLYTNGDSAQLQELVVDSAARDRGIGSQLVTAVERECRARGVRQLTVASIRAAAFYERLDYRSTADFLKKSFLVD
jgi:ribosomal protein S18 acetylase RimI-like enzyme